MFFKKYKTKLEKLETNNQKLVIENNELKIRADNCRKDIKYIIDCLFNNQEANEQETASKIEFQPCYDTDEKKWIVEEALCTIGGCTMDKSVFESEREAKLYCILKNAIGDKVYMRGACNECMRDLNGEV